MLILTSSANLVAKDFLKYLPKSPTAIRLTFISTAAEVEKGSLQWLKADHQALVDIGFQVTDFTLTGKNKAEIQTILNNTDLVFLSGGNTFYLLQEMRKSGFAELIQNHIEKGLVYIGSSAGSVAAGRDITLVKDVDDFTLAPELTSCKGLGLIDIDILPHWGNEHFQERYEKVLTNMNKKDSKLIVLTDSQYLVVEGSNYHIEST